MKNNNLVPVSLIIPTCNRHDDLLNTISSYLSASTLPAEIIIVDQSDEDVFNNTKKDLTSKLSRYSISLKIIRLDEKSLTKARNIGLCHATNNIIIFSDDDIELFEDTVLNTYSLMLSPEYVMCGALDKNTHLNGSKLKILVSCLIGRKEWKQRHIGCVSKSVYGSYPYEQLKGETETRWAMGYFFSIKKDFATQNKLLFDEKLSAYSYAEDLDFTYRYWKSASLKKLHCVLSPKIVVGHLASLNNRLPTQMMFIKECVNRLYLSYKLFPKSRLSRAAYHYSNYWTGIRLLFKKRYFKMWLNACRIASKHKKELSKGVINEAMYI